MKKIYSILLSASIAFAVICAARVCAAEVAPSDFLSKGISSYNRKDYAVAQQFLLKAVDGEFKNVAVAHYYLANTLMQMSKTNAALEEYERCYSLAPFSSFSGYCRMMLIRYGKNPDALTKPGLEKQVSEQQKEKQREQLERPVAVEAKPAADPELAKLSSRLPRLVVITKESPPASDILAGNIYYRSSFLSDAEQRKIRAFDRVEQARQNLSRAESLTHSFVPSSKSFGEGDAEFRTRRAEAEKSIASLLDPFRENVKEAETAFQSEAALYESCLNASRGFQY